MGRPSRPSESEVTKPVMELSAEMRHGSDGYSEAWVRLSDVLDWLQRLPRHTNDQIPAHVVEEIRGWLGDCVTYNGRYPEPTSRVSGALGSSVP